MASYLKKFDKSLQERSEFKHRMRHKMSFTNTAWNRNVHNLNTSTGQRKSKQIIKIDSNGVEKTLRQNEYQKPQDSHVAMQTYLSGEQTKKRPPSRGSQRAHSVLDFDWYGNARDIQHLTKTRPETCVDHIRFETSLRNYPANTSFKAP